VPIFWLRRLEQNRRSIPGAGVGGVVDGEEDEDDVVVAVEVKAGWRWTESLFVTNTLLAFQRSLALSCMNIL
jgi:hypothetical protein